MMNCFNKYYRYMAFANSLYMFLTKNEEVRRAMGEEDEESIEGQGGMMQMSMADKIA